MPDAAVLVRDLHECYQARDRAGAGPLLHAEAELSMPATAEVLVGGQRVGSAQGRKSMESPNSCQR